MTQYLLYAYLIGAFLLFLVHLTGGHFTSRARVTWRGKVRVIQPWACTIAIIVLLITWPVSFPIQVYQNRGKA